jgi:hypothetical protein
LPPQHFRAVTAADLSVTSPAFAGIHIQGGTAMFSSITTGAVFGIESFLMQVETDITDGLPSFSMVGFLSGEVKEAGRGSASRCAMQVPRCRTSASP